MQRKGPGQRASALPAQDWRSGEPGPSAQPGSTWPPAWHRPEGQVPAADLQASKALSCSSAAKAGGWAQARPLCCPLSVQTSWSHETHGWFPCPLLMACPVCSRTQPPHTALVRALQWFWGNLWPRVSHRISASPTASSACTGSLLPIRPLTSGSDEHLGQDGARTPCHLCFLRTGLFTQVSAGSPRWGSM